ncbi:MAG TPA: hypothetical protein VFX85_12985 [Solirubrobacterales bacterium]|nr:hypothetical protein [Solirubrobacterales bacterium]
MSLDSELFASQVWYGKSRVEVFLRGHLWIEHFLEKLLTLQFERPEAVALDRLTWMHKLNLCDGLGLLRDWEISALSEVNRMRNRLAHDLSGEPAEEDIARLLTLSPPNVLDAISAVREVELDAGRLGSNEDSSLADLRFWMFAVVMDMDYRVEVGAYKKKHETKLRQAAAIVAANELTGGSMTHEEAEQAQGLPPWPQPGDSFRSSRDVEGT